MKPIYKTKFGFHVDLSKILLISELWFQRLDYLFEVKFELSDSVKNIIIERLNDEMRYSSEPYGFLTPSGEIVSTFDGRYYRAEDMKRTNFYLRAEEMRLDLLNAWITYRNEQG